MSAARLSRFQSNVLHPGISILLPFTFIIAGVSLLTTGFNLRGPGTGTFILLLVVQAEEAVAANILLRERAGFMIRFREMIIVGAFSYVLFALIRPVPLSQRFQPDLLLVVRTAVVVGGWLLSYVIHARLRSREEFYRVVEGKSGAALNQAIRGSAEIMGDTRNDLLSVKRIAGVFLFVLVMILLIQWLAGFPPKRTGFLFLCAFCLVYTGVYASVQAFLHEFYVTGDGVLLPTRLLRRKAFFAGAMIAGAFVIALLLASNNSVLPYSYLSAFFAWLSSIMPRGRPLPPVHMPSAQSPNLDVLRQLMQNPDQRAPSEFLLSLLRILKIVGIAAAVALVVLFIFGPLVSRTFADYLKRAHPLRALVRKLVQMAQYLRRRLRGTLRGLLLLFRGLLGLFRQRKLQALLADAAPTRRPRVPPRPTPAKRRELSRVQQDFVRLVMWAQGHGVRSAPSRTAKEYGWEIVRIAHAQGTLVESAIGIFEEAMYSNREIGPQRLAEFHRAVETITAGVDSEAPPATSG